MRPRIEAFPIGPFRMMKCDEEEVRELESDYAELEKQIELMKNCGNCKNTGYHRPVDCKLCKNYKYGNTEDYWQLKAGE